MRSSILLPFAFFFTGSSCQSPRFLVSQKEYQGHWSHKGSPFGTQTMAPSSISAWLKLPAQSCGITCCSACSTLENGVVTVFRRDLCEKVTLPLENLADELKALLDDIQKTLFDQAKKFRDEKTHVVHNMEELGAAVENGFAKAMWCGERACEDEIKEKFNASSRNMPFDQEKEWFGDTCVCCGKKAKKVMYFAKAY